MNSYFKFHGVKLDNPVGLPRHIERPEDILRAIPEWAILCVPTYSSVAENYTRNIANDGVRTNPRNNTDLSLSEFETGLGLPAYDMQINAGFNFFITPRQINPNEWSCFGVIFPIPNTESGSTAPQRLIRPTVVDDNLRGIHVGWNRVGMNNIIVYDNLGGASGNPQRLSYPIDLVDRTAPTLVLVTFSTDRGLRIWDNGQIGAVNTDDHTPIDEGIDGSPDSYIGLQNMRGQCGPFGVLSLDLSRPEYTGYRVMLEQFCRARYGVDVPAI